MKRGRRIGEINSVFLYISGGLFWVPLKIHGQKVCTYVHTVKWPTTPVTGSLVTQDDGSTTIEPVVGLRNSARFPTSARLDLKTGRAIATSKGNVRMDELSFTALPEGRIDTRTTHDYWMGITPSFQVLWTF